jgi:hypothetical protein
MNQMSGEFVRTPKRGENSSRYRMGAKLPLVEMVLAVLCGAAVIAAIETGHWFAAPFAALFTWGHAYVATLVLREQLFPAVAEGSGPTTLEGQSLKESPLAKAA